MSAITRSPLQADMESVLDLARQKKSDVADARDPIACIAHPGTRTIPVLTWTCGACKRPCATDDRMNVHAIAIRGEARRCRCPNEGCGVMQSVSIAKIVEEPLLPGLPR